MDKVVTVGTFDGVHRGHMALLTTLQEIAEREKLSPLAITFDKHPLELIYPDRAPLMIQNSDTRDRLLEASGIEVARIEFNDSVRSLTAAEWMKRIMLTYNAKAIVLGYDNSFGSDCKSLNYNDYEIIGHQLNLRIFRAPELPGCSSSTARRAITSGNMQLAEEILGRKFSIEGIVVDGKKIGRKIGFPTANIATSPRQLIPAIGVYAGIANTPYGCYRAVINIGKCPTVSDTEKLTIEAHLINFNQNLYGKSIEVSFCKHLRGEQKFENIDSLCTQIRLDIEEAKNIACDCPQ